MDLKALVGRVASKHLQAVQKPGDIVLDVTAISTSRGKSYKHNAFARPSPYKKGTFIVVIDGTAGQWNVDDFVKDRGQLYIDFGQGWVLENADEVRAAVRKWQKSGPLFERTAGSGGDILDSIIPTRDVMKLMSAMRKEGDEQSAELVYEVYSKIQERLSLTDNENGALNRLRGSVRSIGSWDVGLQRNNIFKAADLLGIKLPSAMF